jgi:hypothetical protein
MIAHNETPVLVGGYRAWTGGHRSAAEVFRFLYAGGFVKESFQPCEDGRGGVGGADPEAAATSDDGMSG